MKSSALLVFAFAALALLTLVSYDSPQSVTAAPPPPAVVLGSPAGASGPSVSDDWNKNVCTVRIGNSAGSAVSISPNTLYTAKHVTQGSTVYVAVDGQWLPATVTPLPGQLDGAILQIADNKLPVMSVRAAKYREPVTILGMKSRERQRGFMASSHSISLDTSEQGVIPGDSGGAVVGDDGCLLGVIIGHEADDIASGATSNPRVVFMVRAEKFIGPSSSSQPQTQAVTPQQQFQFQNQNCPGGICFNPQQQFQQPSEYRGVIRFRHRN